MSNIVLRAGAACCEVAPGVGGALYSWVVRGQSMMRSGTRAATAAVDPFLLASFPLVPYSNRIGNARFNWQGRDVKLLANWPPEPHALHGVGHERRWDALQHGDNSVTLTYTHVADGSWPWPFEATQKITVQDCALHLELAARNIAHVAVPLAIGHHPYFPTQGARLAFAAEGVWTMDDGMLPVNCVAVPPEFDFSSPRAINGQAIDHCFVGWNGRADIVWDARPLRLRMLASNSLPAAVLFVKPGNDFFCLEPVPHVNNALNLPHCSPAMPVVEPGDSFRASILLEALPA